MRHISIQCNTVGRLARLFTFARSVAPDLGPNLLGNDVRSSREGWRLASACQWSTIIPNEPAAAGAGLLRSEANR